MTSKIRIALAAVAFTLATPLAAQQAKTTNELKMGPASSASAITHCQGEGSCPAGQYCDDSVRPGGGVGICVHGRKPTRSPGGDAPPEKVSPSMP